MRRALVKMHGIEAGTLEETAKNHYRFGYFHDYKGPPISRRLPLDESPFEFDTFPAFFDGLLPEGVMLEALLRKCKLDRHDCFGQLLQVGGDLVGAVTVEALP